MSDKPLISSEDTCAHHLESLLVTECLRSVARMGHKPLEVLVDPAMEDALARENAPTAMCLPLEVCGVRVSSCWQYVDQIIVRCYDYGTSETKDIKCVDYNCREEKKA